MKTNNECYIKCIYINYFVLDIKNILLIEILLLIDSEEI